ncbi:MAG: VWA domain-containing protein [Rickettsiales bacterium]|nr:VWA domain-containing protein [Rickettsiales bacterium]
MMLRRLLKDESGTVIVLFALMINGLMILLALNLDLGRAYLTKTAIGAAVDSAALAAGHEDGDITDVQAFFEANLPPDKYGINYVYADNISVTQDPSDNSLEVLANDLEVPYFIGFSGSVSSGKVSNGTKVQVASSETPLIDYYLVVDVSNSMSRVDSISPVSGTTVSRQQAAKESIRNMVDLLSTYDNEEGRFRLNAVAYGTSTAATLTNFTNLAYFTDAKLDQLLILKGSTCGSCGLSEVESLIQSSSRPEAIKVVIFMTDGYFNSTVGASGPTWPLRLELNQCLGFCGGAVVENGDTAAWQTTPTGYNSPIYDVARSTGEFNTACDTNTYAIATYPAPATYPASFPTALQDQCMPAYAEVIDYCDQIKALNENTIFWTIRFGDFTSEAGISTAHAEGITGATMDYCASAPENSRVAQSGVILSDVLTEIVNSTVSLRLLR